MQAKQLSTSLITKLYFCALIAASTLISKTATSQGILREVWMDIRGSSLDSLEDTVQYPSNPLFRDVLPTTDAPLNWASNYGTRLRGYVTPVVTGNYTFWIAGDDQCELLLSPTNDPGQAYVVAGVPGYTSYQDWDKYVEQQSDPVYMEAGVSYYIEALHKEGYGGDSVSIAWAQQGGFPLQIIDSTYLTPFEDAPLFDADNPYLVSAGDDIEIHAPRESATLSGVALNKANSSTTFDYQWSQISGPATVQFVEANTADTEAIFPTVGTYVLSFTASTDNLSASDTVAVEVKPALASNTGTIIQEIWLGVYGNKIENLTESSNFPLHPSLIQTTNEFVGPTNLGDIYGTRTRGYIYPPQTGNYVFAVSGNDAVQLHISSDDTKENLQLLASLTKSTNPFQWNKYPADQQSTPIFLEAGTPYYFELLHKENWSSDHHAVAWSLNGSEFTVIGGEYIAASDLNSDTVPELTEGTQFAVRAGEDTDLYSPDNKLTFEGEVVALSGSVEVESIEWIFESGPVIPNFSSTDTLTTEVTFGSLGVYQLRLTVTASGQTQSDIVTVNYQRALANGTGTITRNVWLNTNGHEVDSLFENPDYPEYPDITDRISSLQGPSNFADRYGTQLQGYLHPHTTGFYTFYINGDDRVRLSLSTDENPNNSSVICETTRNISSSDWDRYIGQKSTQIWLEKGNKYYIELLHKEQWGSDHYAVAWTFEEENNPKVITSGYLSPLFFAQNYNPNINYYAETLPDRTYYWPHNEIEVTGNIHALDRTEFEGSIYWYIIRLGAGNAAVIEDPFALDTKFTIDSPGTFYTILVLQDGSSYHFDYSFVHVLDPLNDETEGTMRSVWLNVYGDEIEDLMNEYPDLSNPTFQDVLPNLEGPSNWAHFHGTQLQGFIHPSEDGEYTFWISGDNDAELWLSSDDSPSNKTRIAYLPRSTYPRDYDRYDEQESLPVTLEAGQKYYVEVMHKEQSGNDHFAIAWDGPGTNGREVVNAGHLSPLGDAPAHNAEITIVMSEVDDLLWPTSETQLSALVYDLKAGPNPLIYEWTYTSTDGSATFQEPNFPTTPVSFSAPGTYEITLTVSDGINTATANTSITVHQALASDTGSILREVWLDIDGYYLDDFLEDERFPQAPEIRDTLLSFETPSDWADHYGTKMSGYVIAPVTGEYQFFIAGNHYSELWFNPNGTNKNDKQRIAYINGATNRRDWDRYDSQASAPITLRAGERYYIEALHREYTDSDHLAVAWLRPGATEPEVIHGAYIVPFENVELSDSELLVFAGKDQEAVWPVQSIPLQGYVSDLAPGPETVSHTWSKLSGPGDALFDVAQALKTNVSFSSHGEYVLRLTATDGINTRTSDVTINLLAPLAANTGSILREVYQDVGGSSVMDLLNSDAYQGEPALRELLTHLDLPRDWADRYGQVLRGYLHPPVTGYYRFNIASDDWGEMFLSRDDSPEHKAIICFVPGYTDYYEWDRFPDYQNSAEVYLEAGNRYYIEIRHKDNGWRDHLSLTWLIPESNEMEIISGGYLSPFELDDVSAPSLQITGGNEITLRVGQTFVDPGFTATDDIDGDLTGAVQVSNTVDTSTPGTYLVRYQVYDSSANQSQEIVRTVHVVTDSVTPATYPTETATPPTQSGWTLPTTVTDEDAVRFLTQATFGATQEDIARLKSIGYEAWIDEQLGLAPSLHLEELQRTFSAHNASMMNMSMSFQDRMYTWWTHAITAPDQLRQRTAFALSEVMVISDFSPALSRYPQGVTNYYDILVRNAFGDYRQLLEEVTLSPMMGIYLTMLRSTQASPDENYPREVLQLFSIGLHYLNTDGTPITDNEGNLITTYDQPEILDLSRAFTGWTFSESRDFFYTPYNNTNVIDPMIPFEEFHDRGSKTLLGGFTTPAGLNAREDLELSLDNIADHPNVGPFIARRLIQRLVTSNPSPAYIYRVASAFNDNGSGERGDLGAVVKAILLDEEARNPANIADPHFGKVKEPLLRLSQFLRAFPEAPSSNPPTLGRYVIPDTSRYFAQAPMYARSVFNFFEPDFQQTGSLMDAGLYTPELQITTEITTVEIANYFHYALEYGISTDWRQAGRIYFNYEETTQIAENTEQLLDDLDLLLFAGNMSTETRSILTTMLQNLDYEPEVLARTALQIIAASPEFAIQK